MSKKTYIGNWYAGMCMGQPSEFTDFDEACRVMRENMTRVKLSRGETGGFVVGDEKGRMLREVRVWGSCR